MLQPPVQSVPVSLKSGRSLSPMQRPLWMSQRRDATAPVQNMALLLEIDGEVDASRLISAFEQVVLASDALRTRIVDDGGTARVQLGDEISATDIVEISPEQIQDWARKRASVRIDMARCGYDSVILDHGGHRVSWYLALHHTITDATSSALVFAATAAAYNGEAPALASYYDWARELETGSARFDKARSHWRQREPMAGVGRFYEPVRTPTPGSKRAAITLTDDLLALASERLDTDYRLITEDLGWSALLLTLASSYLHRVTGVDAFSIGLPVHNRGQQSAQTLIGPLMETFPVDVVVEQDDTFRTLHRRVSRSLLKTLRYAVPGTAPAVDSEVVVNVIPRAGTSTFGDLPATVTWIPSGAIDSSHLFRIQLTGYGRDGFELALDLNDGAASENHHERAPAHLLALLDALVADPDMSLGEPTLLGLSELTALRSWETSLDFPDATPLIVGQLESGLCRNDDVALEDGDQRWTGPELWRESVRLAHWLRHHGVVLGSRVGIEMPRSADAVIAIVATLLAGGSYVPIDPTHPAQRRKRLAERADCTLILTSMPEMDDDAELPAISWELPSATSEAYLLFTSGSTGEPKGVPISHLGLSRYVRFAAEAYVDGNAPLVVPLFSSLTFDLTLTSVFLPLVAGGLCVVIREDGPAGLTKVAARTDITWCKATPSHLEILRRLMPAEHQLRTLVVGGEAFGASLARRLLKLRPQLRIFNEYGPTEAVVGCMIHQVDPAELDRWPEVAIGHPAPGVTLRVLDHHKQRVPAGSQGELYIAHPGLTKGYLGPDALQPESDSPFVTIDQTRFYRSGDLVRMADDETLVYLGRVDEQVKVGGIRLDPIEVEAALESHPAIARAAVRLWSPSADGPSTHCVRCGLPSNVPGASFDAHGICDTCHDYERIAPAAQSWFRTRSDLEDVRDQARAARSGDYDCLHLLSGGKDSTYALYQLVELGFKPYALTLDNGFISEGAIDNVRRSVADLGIDHEFATSDVMNDIFSDSLARYSNVCQGCYKTIYTLATNRAVELGIPLIVTGLSRGQLFETRLIPQQFSEGRFDPDAIDRAIVEARKVYHRVDDLPNRLLDTEVFQSDDLFEEVRYVDFYRYVDVELADMLSFLDAQAPWVRPRDTGRSTNCLVNAAGIFTHKLEQGYHNYAEPYAWDVRLGHKTRAEAMEELDDPLDLGEIESMLTQIDYQPTVREILTAWMELAPGQDAPSPAELRAFLSSSLPTHFVPAAFVAVDELPLAASGKLDTRALPAPERIHRSGPAMYVAPGSDIERTIIAVWERVLGTEPVGLDDDFFALGGDSLAALEMIVRVSDALGMTISEELAFLSTTPRQLADAIDVDAVASPTRSKTPPPAARTDWPEPPPLSVGEKSILFERQISPDSLEFNVGRVFRIGGPVEAARFEAAVRVAAAQHIPLSWSYGNPRRHLGAEAVRFELADQAVDHQGAIHASQQMQREAYDLGQGPLLRGLLQPMLDGTTTVLLAIHHVSGDAGSLTALWEQIEQVYTGENPAELRTDYAGFTTWQAEALTDDDREFWAAGPNSPDCAKLAINRPPIGHDDGFIRRPASFSLTELRTGSGASGFAVSLGAFAAVLRRYSDGPDSIGLGIVASTRDDAAADGLVGYFLNSLPVQVDVVPNATLRDMVQTAGTAIGHALSHRTYPVAQIVADRRSMGAPLPALDALLVFEELHSATLGPLDVTTEVLFPGSAVADMTAFVEVHDDEISLGLEYRGSIISETDARRLLDDFDAMVVHAIHAPGQIIDEALLPSDRSSMLVGPELASVVPTIETILRNVAVRGDAPAVTCAGSSLSWTELGETSRRVAAQLHAASVGPGDRVVVCLQRSTDLISAIVAVLRIGASYVPIDPSYPEARIRLIAELSGAGAAVTNEGQTSLTESDIVIDVGYEHAVTLEPESVTVGLDDEAYVIFTSGSTGEPRGVPVRHGQLAASNSARSSVYDSPPERFLLLSSIAFDSSIVGLFWTLCAGGTVVIPSEAEAHDPGALVGLFAAENVSHALMVPTLYQALLEMTQSGPWPKVVIVAGEACPPNVVERHIARHPQSSLVNEYGPTEATVWATAHVCQSGQDPVPIGEPIPGAWVAVADPNGAIRPAGVVGELLIGGSGLVGGYLNDPEADAERFRVTAAGQRYFRTGDRAVVADDSVLFLGRADHQLNIGGVRAEPEEIEAVLCGYDGVAAAIVTMFDPRSLGDLMAAATTAQLQESMSSAAGADDPEQALTESLRGAVELDLRVVAHVETGDASALDLIGLRARARDQLPPFLRPMVYAIHERLPRSPNGKLDREAAANLEVPSIEAEDDQSARALDNQARSETSAVIADAFTDVLGVTAELDDSFFDLGGHSLLALKLLERLESTLGVPVPMTALYESPTPNLLSLVVDDQEVPAERPDYLVPIQPLGDSPPIFAIHVLGANGKYYKPLSDHLGVDQPVFGLGVITDIENTTSPSDVATLARHYADALVQRVPHGPVHLAAVSLGSSVCLALARELQHRGREVGLVAFFDAAGPAAGDWEISKRRRIAINLAEFARRPVPYLISGAASTRARTARVAARAEIAVRRKAGLPLRDELRRREFVMANINAAAASEPVPYDGPITVFKALEDPFSDLLVEHSMGWADVVLGDVAVVPVPGDHMSLLEDPHNEVLAEVFRKAMLERLDALDRARARTEGQGHLVGTSEVQAELQRALAEGRLIPLVGKLMASLDRLEVPAARLVERVDEETRKNADLARLEAVAAVQALRHAGLTASHLVPERLQLASFAVSVEADPTAAVEVLAAVGYRLQDPLSAGAWRSHVRYQDSCTLIADDATTTRLVLRWGSAGGSRLARVLNPTRADHLAVDLPNKAWWLYSLVRPIRLAVDRVRGARAGGDLGVFLGTPIDMIEPLLQLAAPDSSDLVLDIGCGDGRVLIEAARSFGCRGRGIEHDPQLVRTARNAVRAAGLEHRIEIVEGDAGAAVLSDATVVFVFLPPEATSRLLATTLEKMPAGGRLLTHEQTHFEWPISPSRSQLVVAGGVTVAHLWCSSED